MSFYSQRTAYFRSLAQAHKLVQHTVQVDGEARNSFHRFDDESELMAACVNFAHFPCVVHIGLSGRLTSNDGAVAKRRVQNSLLFLQKVDHPTDMNGVEAAYDTAFEVMEQFISRMLHQYETTGSCGPFDNLDLGRFSFAPVGPIGSTLFGWQLDFEDDTYAQSILNYDPTKWQ